MVRTAKQVWAWVERILRIAEARNFCLQTFDGYAEPGYDDPECGVVALGDWNNRKEYDRKTQTWTTTDDTPERIGNLLERLGSELEWEDEWVTCEDCNKIVRCSGDSYSWKRSYVDVEGTIVCEKCLLEDESLAQEHLEGLEGNTRSCVTVDGLIEKLEDFGYTKHEGEFESGWHEGQNDDPKKIGAALEKLGIKRYLFTLDSTGQFDIAFSVWIHKDDPAYERRKFLGVATKGVKA